MIDYVILQINMKQINYTQLFHEDNITSFLKALNGIIKKKK